MKKIYFILCLISTSLTSFSTEFTRELDDFTSVEVVGNYVIKFVKSTSTKLVVDNKDVKVEDNEVLAVVHDGKLKIQLQRDTYVKRNITMTLYYKNLDNIAARRGTVIQVDKLITDQLALSVQYGGRIKLEAMVTSVNISIKSGGTVKISGVAEKAEFSIQTGGTIAASFFPTKIAVASVQMGGEMILNVTEELNASVKAGGEISFKGKPTVNKTIKLGGKIESLDN